MNDTVLVIDKAPDPVYLDRIDGGLMLRIGEPKPGETRTSILTIDQARMLAHALLLAADRIDAGWAKLFP